MSLLDRYRDNWPRVGAVLGAGLAGATALASRRLTKPQTLSALNLAALTAHQYEEYEDPGYFPGQFNGGIFHSTQPDRYPLNTNTALIVNVPLAYTFYALPIVFPKHRVLGIAPVMFGFLQAVGHGAIFPKLAGDRYSPGFLGRIDFCAGPRGRSCRARHLPQAKVAGTARPALRSRPVIDNGGLSERAHVECQGRSSADPDSDVTPSEVVQASAKPPFRAIRRSAVVAGSLFSWSPARAVGASTITRSPG